MSSNVNMSLDDIISKNRKGGSRGGRGTRGSSRGGNRQNSRGSGRGGSFRGRVSSQGRSNTSFRRPNQQSNVNGNWSHDMYYGGASATRSISTGPAKLNITNLDYGVSDSDIKELFSEFGQMRTAAVHYDKSGRSLGSANVVFDRRSDAQKALKQYNGVHLDGRPMTIAMDGESSGAVNGTGTSGFNRSRGGGGRFGGGGDVKRLQGSTRPFSRGSSRGRSSRGGGRGRGTGGGRGRGGRSKGPPPSAAELDKELDAYVVAGATK